MSDLLACGACGTRLRGSAACAYCAAEARNGTLRQTAIATLLLGLAVADGTACQAMYGAIITPDDDGYAPCVQLDDTDADTDAPEDTDPPTCDCDDYDAAVHPGAEEEPGDGVDSNCDGEDDT